MRQITNFAENVTPGGVYRLVYESPGDMSSKDLKEFKRVLDLREDVDVISVSPLGSRVVQAEVVVLGQTGNVTRTFGNGITAGAKSFHSKLVNVFFMRQRAFAGATAVVDKAFHWFDAQAVGAGNAIENVVVDPFADVRNLLTDRKVIWAVTAVLCGIVLMMLFKKA